MILRLVPRLPAAEPITWDESRRLAECSLKWRSVQREAARAVEAARERRQNLLIFWGGWVGLALLVLGWAWAAWELWPR